MHGKDNLKVYVNVCVSDCVIYHTFQIYHIDVSIPNKRNLCFTVGNLGCHDDIILCFTGKDATKSMLHSAFACKEAIKESQDM